MYRRAILSGFTDSELTQDQASELFDQVLEQGIFDKRNDGRYGIPIPSMQTWLLNEYWSEKHNRRRKSQTRCQRFSIPREIPKIKIYQRAIDQRGINMLWFEKYTQHINKFV